MMTAEEIAKIVRVGARLGIRKIRITGGEPLVRADIVDVVAGIAAAEGIEDVSMTTNGILLAKKAAAGLPWASEPIPDVKGNGPSEDWRFVGGKGSYGLIHPISDQFCAKCNRLRLTADGQLKPCLYWVDELNLRPWVDDEAALERMFFRALDIKPENHEMAARLAREAQSHVPTARRMSQIGG